MPEITQELSGALADRYRIERHLGEGGMATVYLAHDLRHDRKVALKVLRPELAAVIGAERFLNEIKVTANLQHPHILPLHDSGNADGFLFYAMPYIEGDTLRDKLDRERQLAIEDALAITRSIAGALDYAHRQGVIHRDIKPANILIHDGQALVADFGIALAVTEASGKRLTETGLSIGTPHYMSPEQAVGDREVDSRSDIYSLAAMLYEMLAGEPPYGGSTAQAILAKILTAKAAPVSAERDTIPPHIDAAIAKALNRHPADRFPTATAFVDALTNPSFTATTIATAAPTQLATAAPAVSRRTAAFAGVAAAAIAALAFFGGRATAPEADVPLARFVVDLPEDLALAFPCCGPPEALSPDGQWLVFTGGPGEPLYRRRLGRLESEPIPGTEDGTMPFFSPDSRWLGFFSQGRLRKAPMSGGPPVPIADIPQPAGLSWGDNDVIAFVDNADGSLHTVPGAGGTPTPVGGASEGMAYNHPWMLPGGEAALMTLRANSPGDVRMVAVDLATGAADTLGFGTRATYASGYLVFSGEDGTLLAQPFEATGRRTTGPSVSILDGMAVGGPGMGVYALSSQGGLAYMTGSGTAGQTLLIRTQGASEAVELPEQGDLENVAFSPPDGRRVAMVFMDVGESQDIWIWDRDQRTLPRLTVEGSTNNTPVWTPDGARVAFASVRGEEPPQIYWQPADGSGSAERLLTTDFPTFPGSWSPDGETLAIVGERDGTGADIGLLTLGDSLPRWIVATEFTEQHPQISPEGRWLAYTSDRSGQREVYVQALNGEGGRTTVSTDGGHSPRWAPDGDVLYYAGGVGPAETLMAATYTTDGGFRVTLREERFPINDLNPGGAVNYDVSPDGQEFVYIEIGGGGGAARQLVWILNWPEILEGMTGGL